MCDMVEFYDFMSIFMKVEVTVSDDHIMALHANTYWLKHTKLFLLGLKAFLNSVSNVKLGISLSTVTHMCEKYCGRLHY